MNTGNVRLFIYIYFLLYQISSSLWFRLSVLLNFLPAEGDLSKKGTGNQLIIIIKEVTGKQLIIKEVTGNQLFIKQVTGNQLIIIIKEITANQLISIILKDIDLN